MMASLDTCEFELVYPFRKMQLGFYWNEEGRAVAKLFSRAWQVRVSMERVGYCRWQGPKEYIIAMPDLMAALERGYRELVQR